MTPTTRPFAFAGLEVGPRNAAPRSATRDEAVYIDPDRLDLRRRQACHVGFGRGPHRWPGASLARMKLPFVLTTLVTRPPGLRLARAVERKTGVSTRGPERTPIIWEQP